MNLYYYCSIINTPAEGEEDESPSANNVHRFLFESFSLINF